MTHNVAARVSLCMLSSQYFYTHAVEIRGCALGSESCSAAWVCRICVAVATTLRYLLGLLWPDIVVFATYYPAILVATLVCGVPAGITATLLGAVSAWWLFISPTHQLSR